MKKRVLYPEEMKWKVIEMKKESHMPESIQLRHVRYLNNIVEQDHRFIKKRVRSMLGFKSYKTATSISSGVEAMPIIKKGQIDLQNQSVQNQKEFLHRVFGLIA
ncbi:UNVERIFIED_ORG: transposase-like protein [Bacillus proteolyticus]